MGQPALSHAVFLKKHFIIRYRFNRYIIFDYGYTNNFITRHLLQDIYGIFYLHCFLTTWWNAYSFYFEFFVYECFACV